MTVRHISAVLVLSSPLLSMASSRFSPVPLTSPTSYGRADRHERVSMIFRSMESGIEVENEEVIEVGVKLTFE